MSRGVSSDAAGLIVLLRMLIISQARLGLRACVEDRARSHVVIQRGFCCMVKRLAFLILLCLMVAAVGASPAYAVSDIDNFFTANDYSINTNQTINFYATTEFGHVAGLPTNPYPSNFLTEVNAYHFNKPNTTASAVIPNPNSWTYLSTGWVVSPCWHYYSGTMWFWQSKTAYQYFTAVARSAPAGSGRTSSHGQYWNGSDSVGPTAWVYTTHN